MTAVTSRRWNACHASRSLSEACLAHSLFLFDFSVLLSITAVSSIRLRSPWLSGREIVPRS